MADGSGVEETIRRNLFLSRLDVLGKLENSDQQRNVVKSIFCEIDAIVGDVCRKYNGSVRHADCHSIVDIWPIAERTLYRIHEAILRRLRSTPTSTTPWFCSFTKEIPLEVFYLILNKVLRHNSFGHTSSETPAVVHVYVVDTRKANYIFNRMNDENDRVPRNELLKKVYPDTSYAEVIVNIEDNLTFKYNKNSEILTVSFKYGFWNCHGIAQH